MLQLLLAAPNSGSGKTTVTCALLAALKKMGHNPCAFKCGPDYIDPMFHRAVLGVESHNLDLFLSSQKTVRTLYASSAAGHDAAICEGVMGFYDGLGGVTDTASAWHLADTLDLPVLLVVQPKGASLTVAAQIKGLIDFRAQSRIAGVLLNDCSESLYKMLAPMLERETGVPMLGYLPHLPQAVIGSRHLGLYTAAEVKDLQQKLDVLADAACKTVDWERLLQIYSRPLQQSAPQKSIEAKTKIAVAHDEAFCFTYAETIESLEAAGAEIVFFSPLKDDKLPEGICGIYLPGGYPELHAEELSNNKHMLKAICQAYAKKMPVAAECGGFLYLGQSLEAADGNVYPMAGILPGHGTKAGRLVRFGYAELTAQSDSMLLCTGEVLHIHEFHHWDSSDNGTAFAAKKPLTGKSWGCGFANDHLYAGFPHLYWAGTHLPQRFVDAAIKYQGESISND